jgi:hypothetical protein
MVSPEPPGTGGLEATLDNSPRRSLMSVESYVFLRDERLPSVADWQQALDRAGTGIVIDPIDDLRRHTGYLPARFNGHESGFEWYYGPAQEILGQMPEAIGDRTHAVDFVTHSDMRELICGLVAGAILAKLADGLVLDEESGEFSDGDKALELARRAEAEYL